MSTTAVASMTVTYVSSGFSVTTTEIAGTLQRQSQLLTQNGFGLSTATDSSGFSYEVVTLNNQEVQKVPPSVTVETQYSQSEGFGEVDFTTSFTAIPEGTQLEIVSSLPAFTLSKRAITGNSNIGLIGKNLGPFDATFTINLWIPDGNALTSQSALSVTLAYVDPANSGPQKLTRLAKTSVKLAQ